MLRDHREKTNVKFEEAYPEVLEMLRNAVRASSTSVSYKVRSAAPRPPPPLPPPREMALPYVRKPGCSFTHHPLISLFGVTLPDPLDP